MRNIPLYLPQNSLRRDENRPEWLLAASQEHQNQLSFFQLNDPVLEQIREELVSIDINTLTPVEALMKLNEIKKLTAMVTCYQLTRRLSIFELSL